jgi:3-deoxy-D-manno-octulosonic-acid transferase
MRALAQGFAAVAALAGAPLAAAALALRPSWREGLGERLGAVARARPGGIWIHAASVGEIVAASRLVDRLRRDGHPVVTSTVTLTGRDLMRRTRPDVPCSLAPVDHPWCVERALARVGPAVLVLVETELWPCWIAAARRRGIPVVLVSGRVSDRSYPRYRRVSGFVARTLQRLDALGVRTEIDAERFRALGADPARIAVTGDLKLEVDEDPRPLAPELVPLLGAVPLFVAGSTHPGEEAAALDALEAVERAGIDAALAIAPRRPNRTAEVARLVAGRGRALRRRSSPGREPLRPGEVLVMDTVGDLAALYGRADVAFVGGSLVPIGGHNVLEPVCAGRPVLFGRHTANVRHAVEILERCEAGRAVDDAASLADAVVELLSDPAAATARGAQGCRALRSHRGSAGRAAQLVEAALAASRAA